MRVLCWYPPMISLPFKGDCWRERHCVENDIPVTIHGSTVPGTTIHYSMLSARLMAVSGVDLPSTVTALNRGNPQFFELGLTEQERHQSSSLDGRGQTL